MSIRTEAIVEATFTLFNTDNRNTKIEMEFLIDYLFNVDSLSEKDIKAYKTARRLM